MSTYWDYMVSGFLETRWFSEMYRQLFMYFLTSYCLGKFSACRVAEKVNLKFLYVINHSKTQEVASRWQSLVTMKVTSNTFLFFMAFTGNIFNLLLVASPSLPYPKSGYSLIIITKPELWMNLLASRCSWGTINPLLK